MQFMRKNVQLLHDMATKGVDQLLGDPNCEASQWLMDSFANRLHLKQVVHKRGILGGSN